MKSESKAASLCNLTRKIVRKSTSDNSNGYLRIMPIKILSNHNNFKKFLKLFILINKYFINFSFLFTVLNVAAGKAPMQSSVLDGGIPQKAVDGSTSTFYDPNTCTLTEVERAPWWYVNLLEPYMVQLVRVDFGQSCCGK